MMRALLLFVVLCIPSLASTRREDARGASLSQATEQAQVPEVITRKLHKLQAQARSDVNKASQFEAVSQQAFLAAEQVKIDSQAALAQQQEQASAKAAASHMVAAAQKEKAKAVEAKGETAQAFAAAEKEATEAQVIMTTAHEEYVRKKAEVEQIKQQLEQELEEKWVAWNTSKTVHVEKKKKANLLELEAAEVGELHMQKSKELEEADAAAKAAEEAADASTLQAEEASVKVQEAALVVSTTQQTCVKAQAEVEKKSQSLELLKELFESIKQVEKKLGELDESMTVDELEEGNGSAADRIAQNPLTKLLFQKYNRFQKAASNMKRNDRKTYDEIKSGLPQVRRDAESHFLYLCNPEEALASEEVHDKCGPGLWVTVGVEKADYSELAEDLYPGRDVEFAEPVSVEA